MLTEVDINKTVHETLTLSYVTVCSPFNAGFAPGYIVQGDYS